MYEYQIAGLFKSLTLTTKSYSMLFVVYIGFITVFDTKKLKQDLPISDTAVDTKTKSQL